MKFDLMLEGDLRALDDLAVRGRDVGLDGSWVIEARHDPFVALASVARAAPGRLIGTAVAVAFARTPMTLASAANDLQLLSNGHFVLGLGSQVKPHIERRFSMPWSNPISRMREFVAAMRAIWHSWETGDKLDFQGDFYTHTLMTPTFSPGPNPFGRPKVMLGGLGPAMTELAGEIADGLIVHRMMSERYLAEVTLPAVRRGLERAGRAAAGFELVFPPFVVSDVKPGEDRHVDTVRKQVAFYGSTPAYRTIFDHHGLSDLHEQLHALSRQSRWNDMTQLIDDSVLETFAVVTDRASEREALEQRFGGLADRVVLYP